MEIQMFNFWYFFWIVASVGIYFATYFLLKNRTEKTQKITLLAIMIFALALHFLKATFPPYSTDQSRWYRDSWFINICAANILLFPVLFVSKSKVAKDYMFYIGVFSGLIAILYPMEPMVKIDQSAEILDIIRFYIHHTILWMVPMLMITLKLHKISYKRVIHMPACLMALMLFIMLNQILQSELGFVPLRGDDITAIGYKNSSYIWGPDDSLSKMLTPLCPNVFKTVPVGEHAGETKYWPWFWLIVPAYVVLTPLCFAVSMIFDHKNFTTDLKTLKDKIAEKLSALKQKEEK